MNDTKSRDLAAEAVVTLGLLNNSLVAADTEEGPVLVTASTATRFLLDGGEKNVILALGSLGNAVKSLAPVLTNLALYDNGVYAAAVSDIQSAGTVGWLICTPVGGAWPDALLPFVPDDIMGSPSSRSFPLFAAAMAMSEAADEDTDMDAMCQASPETLFILPEQGGMTVFCGWSSKHGRPSRVYASRQDFLEPWTVTQNPDGSDYVLPAEPMVCIDPASNAWGRPLKEQEKGAGGVR